MIETSEYFHIYTTDTGYKPNVVVSNAFIFPVLLHNLCTLSSSDSLLSCLVSYSFSLNQVTILHLLHSNTPYCDYTYLIIKQFSLLGIRPS